MSIVSKAALSLFDAGITTIPIALDGSKRPIGMWGEWIEHPPERAQVELMFKKACGIAVLCGPTSCGLECIDFDQPGYFDNFADLVHEMAPGLLDKLTRIQTPRGHGFHLYYRTDETQGNQKLAMLMIDGKRQTAIETRGKGGYAIIPPSPPEAHPSKNTYKHVGGPALVAVCKVTAEEREMLLDAARSLNLVAEDTPAEATRAATAPPSGDELRPGDDFNARGEWRPLLERHGWRVIRQRGEVIHWQRPGKDGKGISATTGHCGDKLYVFSSNAPPFNSERTCSKFWAYALLEHGGNFADASRQLRKDGYGSPPKRKKGPLKKLAEEFDRVFGAPRTAPDQEPPPRDEDAPPDLAPPPTDADEPHAAPAAFTAAEVDALTDDSVTLILAPENFARLLASRDNPQEWLGIIQVLRKKRIKREVEARIKDADRRVVTHHGDSAAGDDLRSALKAFGVFPVSGVPKVPHGYLIKERPGADGIRLFRIDVRQTKDGETERLVSVCDRVPVVSAILYHRNGTQETELSWPARRGRGWTTHHVDAEKVLDASKMGELCNYGFAVTSETRREMVRWLDAYMRCNEHEIEHREISESCGYQNGSGFLIGETFIGDENKRVDFSPAGEGEQQLVEGLSTKRGTKQGWLNMLRSVHGHPRLELALYASLAAPLLKPLGHSNFVVEWAGKTSSGKTTALRLAASVWGENADGEDASLLQNWSATQVGLERYLATMGDLPTLIDETQSAEIKYGKSSLLQNTIYGITGQGKMRGAKTGSRSTAKWRTVLLTTGEQKLSDLIQGGGAAARVLSTWGSPTEGMTSADVSTLRGAMSANCGHAGAEWVQFILDNKAKWGEWRELHVRLQEHYAAQMKDLPDQNVVGRLSSCMAVLGVAAHLAIDALDLPWATDDFDQVQRCVEYFATEIEQISRPKQALESVADFIGARLSHVLGTSQANQDKPPNTGWIGRLPRAAEEDDALCLFVDPLKRILGELGFSPESIIRQWKDSGITGGRTKARGDDPRQTVGCYKISLKTLSSVGLDLVSAGDLPTDTRPSGRFAFG